MASVSDVSIFFIKPLFSKKASSPTKMGELMSLGIPLICNDNVGDVEAILRDGGNGVLMSNFEDAACTKAIAELDAVLQADPQLNMQCALKHYSLQDGVKRYLGVYEQL
jgi:glycosyltransferase involved in cell wall biosynthesis